MKSNIEALQLLDADIDGKTDEEKLKIAIEYVLGDSAFDVVEGEGKVTINHKTTYSIDDTKTYESLIEELATKIDLLYGSIEYTYKAMNRITLNVSVEELIHGYQLQYNIDYERWPSSDNIVTTRHESVLVVVSADIQTNENLNINFDYFRNNHDILTILSQLSFPVTVAFNELETAPVEYYDKVVRYFEKYNLEYDSYSLSFAITGPNQDYRVSTTKYQTGEMGIHYSIDNEKRNGPIFEIVNNNYLAGPNAPTISFTFTSSGIDFFIRLTTDDVTFHSSAELDTNINALGEDLIEKFELLGFEINTLRCKFKVNVTENNQTTTFNTEQLWDSEGNITDAWSD